ncbi:MAG: VCBS repeat-containing protein [Acidobacteriia bacterium]|nr:VCBS repeat-containing protein [Terriglobia bacterium]
MLDAQSFSFQPSFQVANFPTGCPAASKGDAGLAVGDFNADGVPDVAIVCNAQQQISMLLGKRDGTFRAPVMTFVNDVPVRLINNGIGIEEGVIFPIDVNGDGKTDLVYSSSGPTIILQQSVTTSVASGTVTVLLSQGDGTFAPPNTVATNLAYLIWGAADLDGDGVSDLVLTSLFQTGFAVMLGKRDGTFSTPIVYSMPAGQDPTATVVAMADFNRGGKPDIITKGNFFVVSSWKNQGNGSFSPPVTVASAVDTLAQALVGDFDGDGKLDLGLNGFFTGFYVLPGKGDGTFQSPKFPQNIRPNRLVALDVNGDGRLDLAQQQGSGVAGSQTLYIAVHQ